MRRLPGGLRPEDQLCQKSGCGNFSCGGKDCLGLGLSYQFLEDLCGSRPGLVRHSAVLAGEAAPSNAVAPSNAGPRRQTLAPSRTSHSRRTHREPALYTVRLVWI